VYDANLSDAFDILRTWHAQLSTTQEHGAIASTADGHHGISAFYRVSRSVWNGSVICTYLLPHGLYNTL